MTKLGTTATQDKKQRTPPKVSPELAKLQESHREMLAKIGAAKKAERIKKFTERIGAKEEKLAKLEERIAKATGALAELHDEAKMLNGDLAEMDAEVAKLNEAAE